MTAITNAVCEDCGKEIHGRSDKRFCDDTCRNNFNRKKRQAKLVPITEDAQEIIRIIKRNYQLLKSKDMGPDQQAFQPLSALLDKGFNPKFFTSTQVADGHLYHFCFECGFRLEGDLIFTIERKEQAEP